MVGTEPGGSGSKPVVTGLTFDREPLAPPLAKKANDLDALRAAVIDAAGVSGALWLSYLFVLFYFLIAAGGVTHKDLFLENPVKLPFLNVDLPLRGFFFLGPLIFLIVHTYVLLHFVVLAGKVRAFDAALLDQVTWFEARASLRRQLPTNIFVQFLAGPREVRLGVVSVMLWSIAVISLVAGPVAVLLFFELQFLPYHGEWITWVQRLAVICDLLVLWTLWPRIAARAVDTESGQAFGWRRPRWFSTRVMRATLAAGCLILAVLVPLVTTFPGETIDPWIPRSVNLPPWGTIPTPVLNWTRRLLVEGEIDPAARRPVSPWSNRLVLPGFDVIDHTRLDSEAKIAALPETVSLRGRQLRRAVLTDAGLRKADLTGADLSEAQLDGADLRLAKLECEQSDAAGQHQTCANLQGASLRRVSLQGTSLDGVSMQGVSLADAKLQGALLIQAKLQGAVLNGANLEGAALI
ncbi:MAG TPA: pentapeptide repeat-containing protein, partial [Acetobacteraceae bacterium]|nr:pentapeptide repeat-containing protein [Acetobacteraceae bacterium]